MSDEASKPTPTTKVEQAFRLRVGGLAVEKLGEAAGSILRDADIPFEVDQVLCINGRYYADVRLGPVIRVPLVNDKTPPSRINPKPVEDDDEDDYDA